jgi:hypothetical protein
LSCGAAIGRGLKEKGLAIASAILWLHHRGSPARLWLAGHDALLFAAALAGAALSARPMVGLI